MLQSTTIIAFDQHAATTVAAVLLPSQRTPALHSLTSDTSAILRFVERLRRQGPVTCCYEAGPCGFELQRALTAKRIPCEIIAPALIPRRAGDRIKTDRRDAGHLAVLARAEALTSIHIPTEQEEAAAIFCGAAKTFAPICSGPAIDSRNSSFGTGAASRRPRKPGPNATTPGSARKRGRCRPSTRRIARICGRSTKPSPGCRPSSRICALSSISSPCGCAFSGCAASAASTTSRRSRSPPNSGIRAALPRRPGSWRLSA